MDQQRQSTHHQHPEKTSKNGGFPLNPPQKAAAEAPFAPLLIVAGAGTGKTRTLTSRIIYFIEQGMDPARICAITFTNKAAQEMRERIGTARTARAGKNALAQGPFLGTFHSLGARVLRKECRAFGRGPNFAIFDDHDSFDLLKKIVKATIPKERAKKDTPTFFSQWITEMKNIEGTLAASKEDAERKTLIRKMFDKYEEAFARNNAFDFDDLIQKPVELFKKRPDILEKYQSLFDAVLVDEYQDINPQQYAFVELLARGHRNLSVVGDDEQTIYSWRYADIKTFLDFDKAWRGAQVHFLEENYRSTANIIRAAAAVAENNRFRTPKKLWTQNEEGERITLFEAWGENEEAEWIAGKIEKIKSADEQAGTAILYRTNAQSRALEQALIRRDLPYQIFGGLKFYERREVKDAVAALRWASNQKDEVARERLEKNLSKRKFAEFRAKVAGMEGPKPLDILKAFLDVFGYFEYLESNFLNAEERSENITELVSFASGFDALPDLLEKISLLQATDDASAENAGAKNGRRRRRDPESTDSVKLMTIHMGKGLEFDNVFIAGACEGVLPHIRSIENEASLEEERRLMYVAMTRAKKKLHVSFFGMPSRFIAEIPSDCIALVSAGAGAGEGDEEDFENTIVNLD